MQSPTVQLDHPMETVKGEPALFPELLAAIVEMLGEDVVIDENSSASALLRLLDASPSQRCLDRIIPLVSRSISAYGEYVRHRHVNFQSSRQLQLFQGRLETPGRMVFTTQLDVTVDTPTGLASLPAVLNSMPTLRRLSLNHILPLTPVSSTTFTVRPRRLLPLHVVDAIGKLGNLEVLVFAPGESFVSIEDLRRLGTTLHALEYLHLPRRLGHRSRAETTTSSTPISFPTLRTLSIGSDREFSLCTAFQEVIREAVLPRLNRINLLGCSPHAADDLPSSLNTLRILETTVDNWTEWNRTEGVERMVLHMDGMTTGFATRWPSLSAVTIECRMRIRGRVSWRLCVGSLLDALLRQRREVPSLTHIHINIPWGLQSEHAFIAGYVERLREYDLVLTYKYIRS